VCTRRCRISDLDEEFRRIVDAHYASVWSYVNALTGGASDAEDLLHQAFLLAFDTLLENDRTIRDMGKWLRGVVRHLVRAWWRDKRRLSEELADRLYELAEQADSLPNRLAQAELAAMLRNCLQQLAPAARRLITARYEQGLRVHEIAAQEKMNVNAARVRLFRIRQTLRSCIESALPGGATP
jgi:RNA polymerase sigma-70 factor (ECF subfamily)